MMEYFQLPNQQKFPKVGLGLWRGGDLSDLEGAIDAALDAGYRHFDTAYLYETENVLGRCIKKWVEAGKGKRENLFITTKLPCNGMKPKLVSHFLSLSLQELGLEYVDLYLVHGPIGVNYVEDREFMPLLPNGDLDVDLTTDLIGIWKAMEAEANSGRVKNIGVSNFSIAQMERILKIAHIPPAVNQVEVHTYFQQRELISFCNENNMIVTAYCPLGAPYRKIHDGMLLRGEDPTTSAVNLLNDPTVAEVAQKYKKTPAQIVLKHLVQLGVAVVPKSSNKERLKLNFDLFNFNLHSDDLEKLGKLDKGVAGRSSYYLDCLETVSHPEFPFEKSVAVLRCFPASGVGLTLPEN